MKRSQVIGSACLLLGVSLWGWASVSLKDAGQLEYKPNVLTLKGSPFGRTVAVAMRGPVDRYFNHGVSHAPQHDGGGGCSHAGCGASSCGHGVEEEADQNTSSGVQKMSIESGLHTKLLSKIDDWNAAYHSRTNQFGSTKVHQKYLMGETQKRLRLSYEMDPSNFAAYGSYFLFLSEALSSIKHQGEETEFEQQAMHAALSLSEHTVRYCLQFREEPTAMLTAAAAAHDFIQVRYKKGGEGVLGEMVSFLKAQHESLTAYHQLRSEMVADGRWEEIPEIRRQEMGVRARLLNQFYKADSELIEREITEQGEQQQVTSS